MIKYVSFLIVHLDTCYEFGIFYIYTSITKVSQYSKEARVEKYTIIACEDMACIKSLRNLKIDNSRKWDVREEMKNAGRMLALKTDLEGLTQAIKTTEEDFDELLQKAVVRATTLIELNQKMREIQFTSEVLREALIEDKPLDVKVLKRDLGQSIYSVESLLLREVQKAMLQTTEVLAETEAFLLMVRGVVKLREAFSKIISDE